MQLGLDATYTLDPEPTGVAVYSREILTGIAQLQSPHAISAWYRPHRFRRSLKASLPANVRRRILLDVWAPGVSIFHGLNQRLPRKKKGRFIATFHDLFVMTGEYSAPEFRQRFTQLSRDAAERADLIIAVSAFTASQVHELLGVERERIRVVHHGVHPALPGHATEPIILHTGALQKRKNIVRLIEAFEQTPHGWKLILAGGNGYGSEEISGKIAQSPRRNDIVTTGYASPQQLDDLYQRASIFAFPSLDEGFGIPVLEAMMRGIPVITSKESATAEIAGDAAILIDPAQTDQIGAALNQLIKDENLRKRMRQQGIEHAKGFTWDRAVRETNTIYRELT